MLLWADEGLGAAIVIDGRLHGGATGGAGEVGFLPLPGTPLVRDVRRGNAGGFQELAGGRPVLALARSLGLRAATPHGRGRRRRSTTPGAGDELLADARPPVRARASPPWSPSSTRRSSSSSGGVLIAGGEPPARRWSPTSSARWPPTRPRLELAGVREGPVLAGALHTALAAARDDVFDTVRHPPPTRARARPVTRRSP